MEFEDQIEQFNQKELIRELKKQANFKLNRDIWEKQERQNKAKRKHQKELDQVGGKEPLFLSKIIKNSEVNDVDKHIKGEDILKISPPGSANQQTMAKSKMQYSKKGIQNELVHQMEQK